MIYQVEIGMPIANIDTPALLVDIDLLEKNIRTMSQAFAGSKVRVRPHIKTHKCPQIARLQIEAGAIGITCAKVSEAEVFASAGIPDILIANQITGAIKIDRATDLAQRCSLSVAVDDPVNLNELDAACRAKDVRLGVLVEVNVGMNRCGVEPGEDSLSLVREAAACTHLDFKGFQAYEGHLVGIRDPEERQRRVAADFAPLQETIALVEGAGFPVRTVSGGGTGTFDLAEKFTPLTEVQVGSYVFMDRTYTAIRDEFFSALTVLSTVVSRPVPERLVTDAGLKSMTSEFGWPALLDVESVKMDYLSEEHAVLTLENPQDVHLAGGDQVRFTPSHVCTTVNLHDRYYLHRDGCLVDIWDIAARGCAQ